ncbi:hypothetical protein [Streptomyces pakalii]|uniref:Uncharacterized protein n=1 Tax=Streptomyces pakalii TaxID=3036494 RepID=A0ABT7DHH2_9ACTN|nr:hypothetical protein [Streptomyces pakalii]MDJ1645279.1 hypothetical protein [Streptomyces pakalii]
MTRRHSRAGGRSQETQVLVDRLPDVRLGRAALDLAEADRADDEAVMRDDTVREAMNRTGIREHNPA